MKLKCNVFIKDIIVRNEMTNKHADTFDNEIEIPGDIIVEEMSDEEKVETIGNYLVDYIEERIEFVIPH